MQQLSLDSLVLIYLQITNLNMEKVHLYVYDLACYLGHKIIKIF